MVTVEEIRVKILSAILPSASTLGNEYIDYHTENPGECGLTVRLDGQQFDILIREDNSGKKLSPF